MGAPTNTHNSETDLSLGQVPQVEDQVLYEALLDIHNAIEALLTSSDDGDEFLQAYVDKQRNNTTVTENYTVLTTDGTVRVNAAAGDITITLHPVLDFEGYLYRIKRIDSVTTSKVTLVGNGLELVDERADGINVSTLSSYTVKAHLTGWDIV